MRYDDRRPLFTPRDPDRYDDREPRISLPYPRFVAPGCPLVHGPARGTTDREGALLWVCMAGVATGDGGCKAYREAGDPTWKTPESADA